MLEEDDEDYDEEENQDQIQSLQGQTDGVGAIKPPAAPSNKPIVIKANHNLNMMSGGPPSSGIPKPPGQGSAPQATKYDPVEWSKYYDSMEMLDDKIPVYYAGSNTGHLFFCLHGAGHTA